MEDLFLRLFNIGVTAGWIVLAVLAVRLLLWRRLPGWIKCALWGVVGVRLLFPFSLESVLSLIPSAEAVPPTITTAPIPTVNVGVPVVDQVINPVISQTMAPTPQASVNPMQVVVAIAAVVWGVGVLLMLGYLALSYWRIYRRVRESAPMEKGVRYCDGIAGAFVLGVLRPCIYLSTAIPHEELSYVLAHERAHLQRGDHVWKPLGYLLLSVYWFHPLLWVAYFLLCRDMESACDEKVLRKLGSGSVKPYAMALVNCSERESKYRVQRCPVAFGETRIEERVKNVLNYRKPKFWVTALSILLVAVTAVCFLTNPLSAKEPDEPITPPNTQETEQPTESVAKNEEGTFDDAFVYMVYLNSYDDLRDFYRDSYTKYFTHNALMLDVSNLNCKNVQYHFMCEAPSGLDTLEALWEVGVRERRIWVSFDIRNPFFDEVENYSPWIPFGEPEDSEAVGANPEWISVSVSCSLDKFFTKEDFQNASEVKRQRTGDQTTYKVILQEEVLATIIMSKDLDSELENELIKLLTEHIAFLE